MIFSCLERFVIQIITNLYTVMVRWLDFKSENKLETSVDDYDLAINSWKFSFVIHKWVLTIENYWAFTNFWIKLDLLSLILF